jgi:hypothetical protein
MTLKASDETKRQQLIKDVDELCKKYELGFDDFLGALGYEMLIQANKEEHPLIKDLLKSVSDSLRAASFDFYASTK